MGWSLSGVRNEDKYLAIKYMNGDENYPIQKLCAAVHVALSAYYKLLNRTPSHSQQVNEQFVEWIKQHYEESYTYQEEYIYSLNTADHSGEYPEQRFSRG